jgi:hypothetical protein
MSCLAFLPLLSHWLLDFLPAPLFPLAFCQDLFTRIPLPQLVHVAFLVVQSLRSHQLVASFVLTACLNSQMARYLS